MGWHIAVGLLATTLVGVVTILWQNMVRQVGTMSTDLKAGLKEVHQEVQGVNGKREDSLRRVHERIDALGEGMKESYAKLHEMLTKYRRVRDCEQMTLLVFRELNAMKDAKANKSPEPPADAPNPSEAPEPPTSERRTKLNFPP